MTARPPDHLSDPIALSVIAPGLTPGATPTEEQLRRIAFHEAAYGRTRNASGEWRGQMPPLPLVREAAEEIMSAYGRSSAEDLSARLTVLLRRAHARLAAHAPGRRNADVELIARERMHDHFYALDEYRVRHRLHDGGWSEEVQRGAFISYDAALVLPYDPASDRVLLVEQFRIGAYARGDGDPWMMEPVAGLLDPGEDPETTARREAEEEAGLTIGRLVHVGSGYASPGGATTYHHHYIGLCEIGDEVGNGGLQEEHEDIRTVPMTADAFLAMQEEGRLRNAPTQLLALALRLLRPSLRA